MESVPVQHCPVVSHYCCPVDCAGGRSIFREGCLEQTRQTIAKIALEVQLRTEIRGRYLFSKVGQYCHITCRNVKGDFCPADIFRDDGFYLWSQVEDAVLTVDRGSFQDAFERVGQYGVPLDIADFKTWYKLDSESMQTCGEFGRVVAFE